jgi:hypothetical protein
MAKANLTAQRLRELLNYNPATGIWTWRSKVHGTTKPGDLAGCASRNYWVIGIDRRVYRAHRLAWLYMTGDWPGLHVDHIDGAGQNNRWSNLRDVDRCVNLQNRRAANIDSQSGKLGVRKGSASWIAEIGAFGQRHYIGTYETSEDAHAAYLAAKRELHVTAPLAAKAADAPPKLGYPKGKSGLRGTKVCGSKWRAFLYTKNGQKHLGMFFSAEAAHAAYLQAKAIYDAGSI